MSDFNQLIDELTAAIATKVAALIQPTQAERRLLDRAGVARYLGLTPDSIDNLRARGILPPVVPISEGKRPKPMWDIRDIDAAIDRLKTAGEPRAVCERRRVPV